MTQQFCAPLAFGLVATSVAVLAAVPASAQQQQQHVGDQPEALNMRLVGYSDLQARSSYQPVIQKQGDRVILYVGHHGGSRDIPKPMNPLTGQAEFNGTSVVDVTDPAKPKYLKHIPGVEGLGEAGGAQMVRTCAGKDLPKGDPAKFYLLRPYGGQGHEVWDVTDPSNPTLLTRIVMGLRDTHKSWWECDTGIAYLVSGAPGWRVKRMAQIYDMSDPGKPVHIRDFGLPGQEPGATGTIPADMHGPISTGPKGNRVYFGYGTDKGGVMQIVDRDKLLNGPKEPTPDNLAYPEVSKLQLAGWNGAHTTFPMLQMKIDEFAKDKDGQTRDIIMIVNEQIRNECQEARQMVWFADVTLEKTPTMISTFVVPESMGHFCDRGGRFGAHSSNESMAAVYYKKVAMVTYFNAGVRAIDVRNPYQPKEIGYYVPAITENTDKRCIQVDGKERCKTAIQSNNVETDERGLIYVVDRANTGLHILELTGDARKAAGLP
jgi:hypothetical protein